MSSLTVGEVSAAIDVREATFVNDRSRDKLRVAVADALQIVRWERLSARDQEAWDCDQLGDDVFCDLSDSQADRLEALAEEACDALTETLWQQLRREVALVAIRFNAECPTAPLRRDHPRAATLELEPVR